MPMERCYPAGRSVPLIVIGYTLLGLGVILLFACIPCWAWFALLGVGLIALGWLLLRLGKAGR